MTALVLSALLAQVPPVELHRTETQREGRAPFDLAPVALHTALVRACRLEETLPMGRGTAVKFRCAGMLDPETARKRCREAAKNDALPEGVTEESCLSEYARGRFLFPGEVRELVIARNRRSKPVAAFEVLEGDSLVAFAPVGDAVLVGIGDSQRVRFAVVSVTGILRAPRLGKDAVDVQASGGRIRITGRASAMQVYLAPQNGRLRVVR
jgi:hypothetical protein